MSPGDSSDPGPEAGPSARVLLAADFARVVRQTTGGRPVSGSRRRMHWLLPATQCVVLHRVAHGLHRRGWYRVAAVVAEVSLRLTGAAIHPGSRLGPGLFVPHPAGVVVCGHAGRDLFVLPLAKMLPRQPVATWQAMPEAVPHLGDGVVLGTRSLVQGAVRIGDGAALGVGVTTLRDVAAGTMAVVDPPPRAPSDAPAPQGGGPT